MPSKALIYVEKKTSYYTEIIKTILSIPHVDIIGIVSTDNSVNVDGVTSFNCQLINAIQQTRCDNVILFSITKEIKEFASKLASLPIQINLILLPINIDCKVLKGLCDEKQIILKICNPLRHLLEIWKGANEIHKIEQRGNKNDSSKQLVQFVEAKLTCPVLSRRFYDYGTKNPTDININHFTKLILIGAVSILVNRPMEMLKSFDKSILSEINRDIRNEIHLTDYSIMTGQFRPRPDQDCLPALRSKTATIPVTPRTALLRIDSCSPDAINSAKLKIKVKMTNEMITIKEGGVECKNSTEFWSCYLFREGLNIFFRQIDMLKQQNTPRLVDLSTVTEDELRAAHNCLWSPHDFLNACNLVQ